MLQKPTNFNEDEAQHTSANFKAGSKSLHKINISDILKLDKAGSKSPGKNNISDILKLVN